MADIIFNIQKVEVSDDGATWVDLGATKGGGRFSQSVDNVEIRDDHHGDPVAILPRSANRTLNITLLDAKPENLALAFAGEVVNDASGNPIGASIPSLPTGVEKQVKITTQPVNGVQYEITIKRGRITGNSEISFTADDASGIPLEVKILSPTDGSNPVEIKKV